MNDFIKFFGFKEDPFKITPDIEYFFMSKFHQEALMAMNYLLESGEGFAVIVGEPGTGKTITVRKFVNELPENVEYAYILFPNLSPEEMFKAILEDFGIEHEEEEGSKNKLFSKLKNFLLKKREEGKKVLIIIDEAQNLPIETLEELRILSNLETDKDKLLQIILLGQPELEHKLNSPELRQLKQRITLFVKFRNLNEDELRSYVDYRLSKAGNKLLRMEDKAYKELHKRSKGNLRLINILMERALMSAYVEHSFDIKPKHIKKAAESLNQDFDYVYESGGKKDKKFILITILVILNIIAIGLILYFFYLPHFTKQNTVAQTRQKIQNVKEKQIEKPQQEVTSSTTIQQEKNHNKITEALVSVPLLNVFEKPDSKSKVILLLKKGAHVQVVDQKGKWIKIRYKTKNGTLEGWVYKDFIVFNK